MLRKHAIWALILALGLLLMPSSWGGSDEFLRYNKIQQKSSHNAYANKESILDQLIYYNIRSLEIDLNNRRPWWPDIPRDWYVYHTNLYFTILEEGSCSLLSDCLRRLEIFHKIMPGH